MNILYHLTILPPHLPSAEALSQEIGELCTHFGGEICYTNPNQRTRLPIPRLLFGFPMLNTLRAREAAFDLHHCYNPDPYPFPYLLYLRRPVIYTVSSGISARHINARYFNRLAAVVVYDERSLERLRLAGVRRVHLVRPGIDTTRFTCTPQPLKQEFRLLVASAPWSSSQFRTKGIDALLEVAQQAPHVHLTFLWRGVLTEHMKRRINRLSLGDRVSLFDGYADVNQALAGAHATIALATNAAIIKAYPHSMLDSLAAGKPVLISRAIPMSDYVTKVGCGRVVDAVTPESILEAIDALIADYPRATLRAQEVGPRDFSFDNLVQTYKQVYGSNVHEHSYS